MARIKETHETLLRRWKMLQMERQSWMGHWSELSRFFAPRAGALNQIPSSGTTSPSTSGSAGGSGRGLKKHSHIYDNTPLRAVDVLAAGLVTGMTSPARAWFRLRTPDSDLNAQHHVRSWLHDVETKMREIFNQSNTYRAFRRIYEEIGVFGTAASIILPDFKDVVRHYPQTIGEFAVGLNAREEVDTLYREFEMTVEQLVGRFGLKNVSQRVKGLYDNGDLHVWVGVLHAIEPRRERNPLSLNNNDMAWKSIYIEVGDNSSILRESGFRDFPAIVPRWKVNGHDTYGEAPAMRALGDNKQLQHQQYRKGQAIDYQTQPPLQVPAALSEAVQKGPGGITIVNSISQKIQPAWETNLNLDFLLRDILDVRQRVSQAMFEDMFLLFSSTRRGVQPPTAEEIVAQQEEKLLMIGPVLENLQDEMLGPKIEKTFAIMLEHGVVEPPPPELEGQAILIRFISTLAQAQRLIGLNSVDRMIGTLVNLSSVKPSVLDKLDGDAVVDVYADALGVDPDLIISGERVALIRQKRAEEAQQAKMAEALPVVAGAAKDLDGTSPATGNAALQALQALGV